jgi:hypothetical protein
MLKPGDFKETFIEKPTTHPGTNGPMKTKLEPKRSINFNMHG